MTSIRNVSMALASILLASGLSLSPIAAQAADVELPVIDPSSVSVSATTVAPGGQITGTFRVTDDVGCCDFNRIDMRNSSGNILLMTTPTKVSGTPTDAIYSSQITVPSSTPNGTYTLHAQATDLFGRYTHLVTLGTFQVQPAAFNPVGAVVAITNVTPNSVVASWSLPAEAEISRVDMAYYNYSTSQWTNLTSSTLKTGSRTISGLTPGTGYAFRTNTYYVSGVAKLGDIQFMTSTAASADVALPVIDPSSVRISRTTAVAGDYITGSFRVTDDVGCCDFRRIDLRTSSGAIVTMTTPSKISGTATDAVFSGTVRIPVAASPDTFSLYAQATDLFGRYTHLVLLGKVTVAAPIFYPAPTLSLVKVGSKTATASWYVAPATETTSVKLVLTDRSTGSTTDVNTLNLKTGSAEFSVKPSTSYSLKVTHTYKDGTFKSDEEFFTSLSLVKPPMPVMKASPTLDSATVSWTYSYQTVDKFVIRIREASGMFSAIDLPSSARSYKFSGLKDNTMYVVEMDVLDTNGEQSVGTVVFTTPMKQKAAPSAPAIEGVLVEGRTATVNWSQATSDDAEAVIGWDVQVLSSNTSTWKTVTNVENRPGSVKSATISSLSPGQDYVVRIVARTASALSAVSVGKAFQIDYLLAAPSGLASTGITWSGATISWTQSASSGYGKPASFRIEFTAAGSNSVSEVRTAPGGTSKRTLLVQGLKSGVTYEWRVIAIGSDGDEVASTSRVLTTVSAMRAPTSLAVASYGDTWARVSWSQIANKAFKTVSSFEIRVSQDQGETWQTLESNLAPNVRVVRVEDLDPETEYEIKVVALSGDGDEASSNITVTTMQNLDSITEATVSLVTTKSAVVSWELPNDEESAAAIDAITVQIKKAGKWVNWLGNLDPTSSQATLKKLAPKTTYEYRIVTIGEDGYKEYSAPKKFRTK